MGRLIALALLIIALIFAGVWLGNGGWARIQANAAEISNPLSSYFQSQKGKTVAYNAAALAPGVPQIKGETLTGLYSAQSTDEQAAYARNLGTPSPSRGLVTFASSAYAAGTQSPASEYVTIRASAGNTSPVDISGWALVSAATGIGMRIPEGVSTYRMGAVSTMEDIYLKPGEEAVLSSGYSPVGASFRTNACTGYLAQFQSFSPGLANACPSPASQMPNTLDNLRSYGASCIDFVAGIPSCTYYLGTLPSGITDSCRAFIGGALSYNGCLDRYQWQAGFDGHTWRVYLGSSVSLWNRAHDVIRLLDASGRSVDVLSY